MVRGSKISKQRLNACSAADRDELLAEAFGLSPTTLSSLRSKRVGEGVYEAARLLTDYGFPGQITTHNLTAILYESWETPDQYTSYVSAALRRRYRTKQQQVKAQYNLSPPYIHFLREEVGAYEGNLVAVRDQYPEFRPSPVDYVRSVRLPAAIEFAEARLLGAYAIDGTFTVTESTRTLRIEGSQKDRAWYQCLQAAIAAIHNLSVGLILHEERQQTPTGETYLVQQPRLKLQSQAVATWLYDDLGFRCGGEQRSLPEPEWPGETRAQQQGLLAGALAGMGRIHGGDRYETTRTETQLLADVAAVAEQLDIEVIISQTTTANGSDAARLVFNTAGVQALIEQNLVWNPRHRRALTANK